MSEIEVRPSRDLDDLRRALAQISHYFGNEPDEEGAEHFARNIELARMHAAWDGEAIVGGAGAFSFGLTVPGGAEVPTAGVTVVGVAPTHRRRGVLTAMMRAQLDDAHGRGEPLALLWSSEPGIYGRFGYGMASLAGEIELPREHNRFAVPFERRGSVRTVETEEALELFPPIYDAVRRETPGMLARSRSWWEHRKLHDDPKWRRGGGPLSLVVLELEGAPAGYAAYRIHAGWENGINSGHVKVLDAFGTTPEATAEIWRFLLDLDWIAKVKTSFVPADHPLVFLLAEPRYLGLRLADALWCRLVDVEAALTARTYASDDAIVFELRDASCPWNEGRWRLEGGHPEPTEGPAEIALDVSALGSVYLGGFTFGELARGLRIEELVPGAVERADAIFATSRLPWCPEIF